VLWVWMDGGIPTFLTFFWLMGAGAYAGGQELASRREAWSLAQLRFVASRGKRRAKAQGVAGRATRTESRTAAKDAPAAGAPPWTLPERRSKSSKAHVGGGPIALLAAGVALVVIQITFSYVDLGLTSGRLMLLLGVLLGVMGRKYVSAAVRGRRKSGMSAGVASPPTAQASAATGARASGLAEDGLRPASRFASGAPPSPDEEGAHIIQAGHAARGGRPTSGPPGPGAWRDMGDPTRAGSGPTTAREGATPR
jgi:hypothetical protein